MNTLESAVSSSSTTPARRSSTFKPSAKSVAEAGHDAGLVRRYLDGDEAAFLEIMHRYRERIFAIVQALLRNHSDAEEITQDTFIRAHRGLVNFRSDSSLYTWLRHIALNLARNRYWYNRRRRSHAMLSLDAPLGEDVDSTLADVVAAQESDPVRLVSVDEFSGLIATCMRKLPQEQRELLTLRSIFHRSYEDISLSLGINAGTVKSRISRARESLRKLMTDQCPDFTSRTLPGQWLETPRETGHYALAVA